MINISSDFNIFKLNDSVFQIHDINYNKNFLKTISSILLLGKKFVPNYFFNETQYLQFLLTDLNQKLFEFNKTVNIKKNSKNYIQREKVNTNDENIIDDLFFNDLFKYLKKKKHINPINNFSYINKETSLIKINIHKEILKQFDNINLKPNITVEQLKCISVFQRTKPFKVIECDKNVGCALISNELYNDCIDKYLQNNDSYLQIQNDPLDEMVLEINSEIECLFKNNHISKLAKTKLTLKLEDCTLGSFRLLAKVHKNKFDWRPIINCQNHPTMKMCWLIDQILKVFVSKTETYIKDSQNLIQKCEDFTFNKKPNIYSMDFSSLYSNLNPVHVILLITDFMRDRIDSKHLNVYGFKAILIG